MKLFSSIVILFLFCSCCPVRHIQTTARDSVRIEVIERTEFVRDTVEIEVPVEVFKNSTRDTTSVLETSYARSVASVTHDGLLHHSLSNKAQKRPIEVDKPIVYRDSIIYKDKVVNEVVEVPRNLTKWQRIQMTGFWILLLIVSLWMRSKIF